MTSRKHPPPEHPPPESPPPVIGHRGAAGHAPENTLAGIRRAHALGVGWVEVDVKLTKDGIPILMHDDTLQRTTSCKGAVAARTLAELIDCDTGAWFQPPFAGEAIPTLAELVAALDELNMGLNLEIKPCPGRERETGRVIGEMFPALWPANLPAPVVSSFSRDALQAYIGAAPATARALIVNRLPADWREAATQMGLSAMHCNAKHIKRGLVTEMVAAGLQVRCYTVNDAALARKLFDWGVQSVFTDFPDRMA